MTTKSYLRGLAMGTLVIAIWSGAKAADAPADAAKKMATSADLGGTDRYLTSVSTDKPIYRANEKMFMRAVILNAATHQPLGTQAAAEIKITGPKGDTVATGNAQSEDSVVGFEWTVPDGTAGGEYTVKVSYPWQGYAPAERKFDVRAYRAPRLKNQIVFLRDGYGAGDKVTATLHTERAEGGIPAGAKVTLIARVDDAQVFSAPAKVDASGNCVAAFDLPKSMERGEGTLAFVIEDGGTVETASKTIPILLQTLDVQFYPEGGDAVAGLDNRFYIEARTPAKKPADLVGTIIDSKGKKIADVKTEHDGRGRFEFTPVKGETYAMKLSEPAGISKTWPLPAMKESGVTIQALDDTIAKDGTLKLKLAATGPGPYKITLSRRETEVAEPVNVIFKAGASGLFATTVELKPKADADGVLTATVWDDKGQPLAERLIYRQPAHTINVAVAPESASYTPGGKAKLNITTTDETGKPISAVVGLTVTDDSVLEMIDKREQAPRLPLMVLLEPEVKDLADAHVYLDPTNPKAALATDLLLGTQGWRRFALVDTAAFLDKNGDAARRVLANVKPEPPAVQDVGGFVGGAARARGGPPVPAAAMPEGMMMNKAANEAPAVGAFNAQAAQAEDQKKFALDANPPAPADAADRQMEQAAGRAGGGGGAAGGGPGGAAAAMPMAPAMGKMRRMPQQTFQVVRVYAHDLRPNWSPTDRSDFTETLYWNAGIKTDDQGHGEAAFAMADSVTAYRIIADSFAKNGALGTGTNTVQSVQPFFIEPKMPLEVTVGDVIQLPVSITNNTPQPLRKYNLTVTAPDALKIEDKNAWTNIDQVTGDKMLPMNDHKSQRQIFTVTVGDAVGDFDVVFSASAGDFSDKVTRKLHVKPKGFPTQIAFGGLLDHASPASKTITIPSSIVAKSMATAISVYPSPVANMTDAVQGFLREPNGCFEQTSSTNYPLAMAEQYFTTHEGVSPALVASAGEMLNHGYARLIGFECKDKGYEWFGGEAPGHEALTAYGLMEFKDMQLAKLPIVDDQMIARTRTWLLSRRDGKGGFERNARSLDSFGGAPELTTNAYIVFSLLSAGEPPASLEKEIAATITAAKTSDDSYVLALAANISEMSELKLHATPDTAFFLDKLAKKQGQDGAVAGGVTSITRSGGEALAIETTALTAQGWLRLMVLNNLDAKNVEIPGSHDSKYAANAQNAVKFLADSCKGGRFGSTQSTVLALKAITSYDTAMAHPKAPGSVTLIIDKKPVGQPIVFTVDTKEPLKFDDISAALTPGEHTVALEMADGSQMPFSIAMNFNSITPASTADFALRLTTTLKDATIAEGGITEERVQIANITNTAAASPTAIIGIPGGLEVRHDQLKELVKAGKIDAYEVRGREVILYWRQLKAGATADLALSLTAAVPGQYTAPASRVYEYYTDEEKQWLPGTSVTITPK